MAKYGYDEGWVSWELKGDVELKNIMAEVKHYRGVKSDSKLKSDMADKEWYRWVKVM